MQSETVVCESNKHVKILNTEKRHAGKRTARRVASRRSVDGFASQVIAPPFLSAISFTGPLQISA